MVVLVLGSLVFCVLLLLTLYVAHNFIIKTLITCHLYAIDECIKFNLDPALLEACVNF